MSLGTALLLSFVIIMQMDVGGVDDDVDGENARSEFILLKIGGVKLG